MVQKEFGQQAQVLTVDLANVAIHFEHRDVVFAVDLVGGRMVPFALCLLRVNKTSRKTDDYQL